MHTKMLNRNMGALELVHGCCLAVSNEIFCKSGSFQKSWLKREKGYTRSAAYLLLVYFVTALVPSLTACFESSPGRCSLTAVWISRLVMVCFLL